MKNNTIPPMTDPLGKHWEQPDHTKWLIDDTHVIMTQKDCDKLLDYSRSQPTGAYEGKMWKSLNEPLIPITEGPNKGKYRKGKDYGLWVLCWFGSHKDPGFLSNNYRLILIMEEC